MLKLISTISLSLLTLVTVANAQPRGGMMMAADELGLTGDQTDRMESMMLDHQKQMIELNAQAKTARLEMRAMMRKAKVDEKAVMAKQDQISELKARIAKARLKQQLAMRSVLTSEQLDKWMQMKREHPGFGKRGPGKRGDCCMQGPHPGMKMGKGMKGHGMGKGMGMESVDD